MNDTDANSKVERRKIRVLSKQIKNIERQEEKILNKKESNYIKSKISPAMEKLQGKIPDKLKETLDMAFYKGFQLVFDKGSAYIEKTYNKDKIQIEHDLNSYALNRYPSRKHIRKLDSYSSRSKMFNSSIAVLEGGALGLLGIGLPDIPLFIAVIIRTINEIALSYGYKYDTDEEKAFILNVICGAVTKGDKQKEFDKTADNIGRNIDMDIASDMDLEETIKNTAKVLSDTLLTAKFIQGLPVVGITGGAVNYLVIRKVGKYASLKYKKRYLFKAMRK